MACAQTGSGKTAAFVLPMINIINNSGPSSSEFSSTQTPDAMVITPTRELAMQIHKETSKFAFSTLCKAQLAYGGASVQHQRSCIRRGCNILIGKIDFHLFVIDPIECIQYPHCISAHGVLFFGPVLDNQPRLAALISHLLNVLQLFNRNKDVLMY